jgi:hypothetical protein
MTAGVARSTSGNKPGERTALRASPGVQLDRIRTMVDALLKRWRNFSSDRHTLYPSGYELASEVWGTPGFWHQGASHSAHPVPPFRSAHANCSESVAVNFCFKWRHRDGSTIEFSSNGWRSNDPEKADWLSKMDQLHGSNPAIPPAIRNWLKQECELIGVRGPSV